MCHNADTAKKYPDIFLASSTLFLGFLLAIVKNQVESTVSLWACLCNLEKQVAPRFCGTIPQT